MCTSVLSSAVQTVKYKHCKLNAHICTAKQFIAKICVSAEIMRCKTLQDMYTACTLNCKSEFLTLGGTVVHLNGDRRRSLMSLATFANCLRTPFRAERGIPVEKISYHGPVFHYFIAKWTDFTVCYISSHNIMISSTVSSLCTCGYFGFDHALRIA